MHLHCRGPVFLAALILFFGTLALPAFGSYDSGTVYQPSIGISSFFPSDAISIEPGKNGTVIAIVANGGNAQASNVSLSFGGTSCCSISASPKSANIPAFGSQNFTIAISVVREPVVAGTVSFVSNITASSLEGASLSSHLTITVLPAQTITPANTPAPTPTPAQAPVTTTAVIPTPTPHECPQPTTNSCCTRAYSPTGCVPQDLPDNGRCASYEYCSEACVCLSNKCSSYGNSDSCGANPQCGWCGGDGKCKQRHEVSCQPAGCNGPGLYCTSACGWYLCQTPYSKCENGTCVYPEAVTATPIPTKTPKPSANEMIPKPTGPKKTSTDITWGDWHLTSAVAGDVVVTSIGLKVESVGTEPVELKTAWKQYAKAMEAEGWACSGIDSISVAPGATVYIPQAINCTRSNPITSEQSNWTSDNKTGNNNTIFVQHVTSEVSVNNTDLETQYRDVKVAVTCPSTFSCPELTSIGNISAGKEYSMEVESSGNSIALVRTRGAYEGKNYEELEMRNSLGIEHHAVTGWIALDSSKMTGVLSLQVMVNGTTTIIVMDITPKAQCPQLNAFIVKNDNGQTLRPCIAAGSSSSVPCLSPTPSGQTWKSCIGAGRYEFVAPVIGTVPVVVRLIGKAPQPSSTANANTPVESITTSYTKYDVLQGALSEMNAGGANRVSSQQAPSTTTATASAVPAENAYVRSMESIMGTQVASDPSAMASLSEESAKASSSLRVERTIEPSPEKSSVKLTFENTGTETLKNVVVFERVPKSVAQSAAEITVWKLNGKPVTPKVVENDPVLALMFGEVPAGETQTVEYEVNKEVKPSGAKEYSAPVVLSYAMTAGLKGGETGAFSFISVFQKWIGGWIFWLVVLFFSAVLLSSYIAYRWIRSKTE